MDNVDEWLGCSVASNDTEPDANVLTEVDVCVERGTEDFS